MVLYGGQLAWFKTCLRIGVFRIGVDNDTFPPGVFIVTCYLFAISWLTINWNVKYEKMGGGGWYNNLEEMFDDVTNSIFISRWGKNEERKRYEIRIK